MGFFYKSIWLPIMGGVSGKNPFQITQNNDADENEC